LTRPLVDADGLVHLLSHFRGHVTADELAVVRMAYLDPAIAWHSFPAPSCLLPGSNIGQVADARFSILAAPVSTSSASRETPAMSSRPTSTIMTPATRPSSTPRPPHGPSSTPPWAASVSAYSPTS
jgi:hypothetical protein